jgi:hypothetical protein
MTNLLVDYSYTAILLLSGASASVPSRTGGALQWGGRPVRRSRSQELDPEVSRACTGSVFGLCIKGTTIWYPNNTRSVVTRLPPFSRAGYSGTERLGDWDQAHTHEGGGTLRTDLWLRVPLTLSRSTSRSWINSATPAQLQTDPRPSSPIGLFVIEKKD